jgi:hypothetical protein
VLIAAWRCAERVGLIRGDAGGEASRAVKRRIVAGQSLYAIGALVGLLNVPLGVAFIILVQTTGERYSPALVRLGLPRGIGP